MDPSRFDALARAVTAAPTRRRALGALAAALGARLGLGAGDGASATHGGCRHDGKECTRAGQCCSGRCANGTCKPCTGAAQCPAPPADEPCKKRVCTAAGRCVIRDKAAGAACPDDGDPCTADVCAGGVCTHPPVSEGTRCGDGKTCQSGACACEVGLDPCGDRCVDLDTSNDHCGACDTPCRKGTCTDGECVGTGPQGCGAPEVFCAARTTACPQSPSCTCATDIEGNAACAKFGTPDAFCPSRPDRLGRECAQNADCGDGFVCIKATKPDCFNCGTIGGTSCEPVCA